jgi:superfamily II RNA helicase
VGAHHAGQLPGWKLVLETLMNEGLLNAVFATSTVAAGVNFPARTAVFMNTDRFNGTEFLPLDATEFQQMTGRAGRRGKDRIGFAVALPGKFMDLHLAGRLVHAPPTDVFSRIQINFSMVLNLLLSHTPEQIENLLVRSFAAYLMGQTRKKRAHKNPNFDESDILVEPFRRHLMFLVEKGYVTDQGRLTEDGVWASQLRVDRPLLIAEGFRSNAFPATDPALLAAIVASFVSERESKKGKDPGSLPKKLLNVFLRVKKTLRPFQQHMISRGFDSRPLFFEPALFVYQWVMGEKWEKIVTSGKIEEGDLVMLILRTADNLRHIRSLGPIFPEAAKTAAKAIELMLREPVTAEDRA